MTLPEDPTAPNNPPAYDAAPTYSQAGSQDQVYQDPTLAAPGYPTPGYPPPADSPGAFPAGFPGQVPPDYPPPGYPQQGFPQQQGYPQQAGYPQQGGYGYTPTGYPAYNPSAQTNTMAIVAIVMAFVFAPLAIVFGHMARKQIRQTGEAGDGLALVATWLGYVFTGLGVLVCGGFVLLVLASSGQS